MNERRERRRKALLADFYGEKGSVRGANADDNDANNIDGPHFDVEKYCETLLQSESLAALNKRDSKLEREVSSLDGEMKTLVYENYNKFISATDTIKQMKQNVEQLDDEMAALETSMKVLSERTATIDKELNPKRKHMQQLASVYGLLEKLQFLVELPQRLQQCIDMKSFGQAVKHYESALPVLKKYSHLASFRSIEQQCTQLMTSLHTALDSTLAVDESSSDAAAAWPSSQRTQQVGEAAALLLELGKPAEHVHDRFLAWHTAAVERRLNHTQERDDVRALTQEAAPLLAHLADLTTVHATAFGGVAAADQLLLDWSRTHLVRYLTAVRHATTAADLDARAALDTLRPVRDALLAHQHELSTLNLSARANDLVNQTANELVAHVLDNALETSTALIHNGINDDDAAAAARGNDAPSTDSADVKRVRRNGEAIGDAISSDVQAAIATLAPLFDTAPDAVLGAHAAPLLQTKLQVKLQQLLAALSLALAEYHAPNPSAPSSAADAATPLHVLRLVHCARSLQLRGVSACAAKMRAVAACAPDADLPLLGVPELQTRFAAEATALLDAYASRAALSITTPQLLQHLNADSNVLFGEEFLAALEGCERDILGCGFSATSGTPQSSHDAVSRRVTSATANALFERSVDAFFAPQFTATSLLAAVLARALKSVIETVRTASTPLHDTLHQQLQTLGQALEPKLGSDAQIVTQLQQQLENLLSKN